MLQHIVGTYIVGTNWGAMVGAAVYCAAAIMCFRAAIVGPIRMVRSMVFLSVVCTAQSVIFFFDIFIDEGLWPAILMDARMILMWVTAGAIVFVAWEGRTLGRAVNHFTGKLKREVERLEDEIDS